MPTIDETFNQAVQIHQSGDPRQAEQLYRQVIQQKADHVGAATNLGVALTQQGRVDEAISAYQSALRIDPKYVDAQFNLGNAYRRQGRFAEAVGSYQAVLRVAPNHTSSHHNLGLAYASLSRWPQAIQAQQQAVKIEPNFAEAYNHLADCLLKVGKIEDAIETFRIFIRLRPNDPRGHHNIGLALAQKGDVEGGIACIQQALRLKPDYAEGHNSLGVLLEGSNRTPEAFVHYQKAVTIKPQFSDALNNLGTACTEMGLHEEAVQYRRMSLQIYPNSPHIHSNLLLTMHYSGRVSRSEMLEEHRRWATVHADRHSPGYAPNPRRPEPDRPLRIGYVSSDFRNHTVAAFIEPLLKHHDRTNYSAICFANVSRPDSVSEYFQTLASEWHSIYQLSDDAAADLIRDNEIDILVDLNGHTAHNRLLVLARKPATIQASVFGYPDTTGMSQIDYRISDGHSDPIGADEFSVESIWRLPDSAWCCRIPGEAVDVGPLPADRNGYITFGSLNNLAKVTPEMVRTWSEIMKVVPNSRLILLTGKGGFGTDRARGLFAQNGIGADRLQLVPRLSKPEYFNLHNSIDLYFDPAPYNGGVTSCDCLWMGTPMVTLAGDSYYSRQGLMLMTNLGLPQFIAKTPQEYLAIATHFGSDTKTLREMRSSLRERLRASTIFDGKKYMANLESAYRGMWKKRLGV